MRPVFLMLASLCLFGCNTDSSEQTSKGVLASDDRAETDQSNGNKMEEAEIRQLIEQLVYADESASNQPIINPNMKIPDSDGTWKHINSESDDAEKKRQKFNSCQEAFKRLYDLGEIGIPILVEHLDDDRQSINFRNHYLGNSVGDACYWNIYLQLVDQPDDYSEYGYRRKGRDGKDHPKPYYEGTPFDDAGGLKEWLKKHENLNYLEMQVSCLQWLLDHEKKIGASDSDSYFLNILPLEIRILERRRDNRDDVQSELDRLIHIRDKKLVSQIPPELLPEN